MANRQEDENRVFRRDRGTLEIDRQRDSQLAIWRVAISGIHMFCNVTLLSMAYALRDGGWRGLTFFFIFFALTISSSIVISHIMERNPTFRSYPEIGEVAFGRAGYRTVWILVFLFTYACCVENTVVTRDTLINLLPKEMFKIDNREVTGGHLATMLMVLLMLSVVLFKDWGIFDITLTVSGLGLTAIVVLSLVWQWIFDPVPHQKTLSFDPSMFPMAIGFYANCFSSHSSLPELYKQTKNRNKFIVLLIYIFVPTAILYVGVGCLCYHLFGNTVEPLFILSMPGHLGASKAAKICTIIHQLIRYVQGISSIAMQVDEVVTNPQDDEEDNHAKSILVRLFLVGTTIVITMVVPFYGPFMAFMASIFGVSVALIIPYMCFLRIRYQDFTRSQVIWTVIVLLVAVTGAILGSIKSAPALAKG
ncbi:vacuolar amino acid transporter 1 [Artemisia annua]|uniref:Vacuolar amino acid transporter 1 n=1 Tax=Artemisia annua TaxID=35608 RepID=A0A2U1P9L3_ARTAN|nr:vacuolar amino acid transporter 1 [Artemisia annua]